MAKKQNEICYTRSTLADLLEISPEEAQALMEREDFPATRITGSAYAVTPENLHSWLEKQARTVEGVNDFSITL